MSRNDDTFTITFGDVAENHVGMEQLGKNDHKLQASGFSCAYLQELAKHWSTCEYIDLTYNNVEAGVLIIRSGVDRFLNQTSNSSSCADEIYTELHNCDWDKKFYNRRQKRVQNKRARYNLCFQVEGREPDYEAGQGRIISFSQVPMLHKLYNVVTQIIKANPLLQEIKLEVEGNHYYDNKKCGIGFHGDAERTFTIGARFGASIPLVYQWYHRSQTQGEPILVNLHHGDMYIMSDKAIGRDWRRSSILTLRHAAGCDKYIRPRTLKSAKVGNRCQAINKSNGQPCKNSARGIYCHKHYK